MSKKTKSTTRNAGNLRSVVRLSCGCTKGLGSDDIICGLHVLEMSFHKSLRMILSMRRLLRDIESTKSHAEWKAYGMDRRLYRFTKASDSPFQRLLRKSNTADLARQEKVKT